MSAVSLFELGFELARAHERSAPGRVTVVPVIVDDLAKARHIFQALCAATEGRMLDAGDSDLLSAVPNSNDVVRRAAIEAALQDASGPRRVVLYEPEPGLIDARFEPDVGTEPSAGLATVLAIARALAHGDLDSRELAIVTYSESAVDYPFRKCVWSLVVDQLPNLPHATLRTLIVVAETHVDVALHCQTGRGFRFAVSDRRLLRRHDRDDLNASAKQIARSPQPLVFFLGAGFSVSSRLPLGNWLRDAAIRRLLGIPEGEPISSNELGIRFHQWASQRENWLNEDERAMREDVYALQLTLEQVIRAEKRLYNDLPTLQEFFALHEKIIRIPGSAVVDFSSVLNEMVGRVIIVEVNFDRLVEEHALVPLKVFFSEQHFADAPAYIRRYLAGEETNIPVLKLHGSIESPESCVASDEQTRQGVGQGKLEALKTIIEAPTLPLWVYVGASMRDQDLLPVLRSEEFARGLDERWVTPYLDATVEAFAKTRVPFWARTSLTTIDDRLITETADAFFAALRREFS
jgi:hypothetical protein